MSTLKAKIIPLRLKPITIDYKSLLDPTLDLSKQIQISFGKGGNGVMLINNIPKYPQYRKKLLPLAAQIHKFPREIKAKYQRPEVFYAVGICTADRYSYKGVSDMGTSWYCNTVEDKRQPVKYVKDGKEVVATHLDNFWPTQDLPQLEPAFKNMGKINSEVGFRLSHHIEKLVKKLVPNYQIGTMKGSLQHPIGRLVHYHNTDQNKNQAIFWHNDISTLTTLCSPMYMDQNGKIIQSISDQPDNGLQILMRDKSIRSCCIPSDSLAIQTAQSLQIITGGKIQATPHRVTMNKYPQYTRQQFVNFFMPRFDYKMTMPQGCTVDDVLECQSDEVDDLRPRWTNGMYFRDLFDMMWKSFA